MEAVEALTHDTGTRADPGRDHRAFDPAAPVVEIGAQLAPAAETGKRLLDLVLSVALLALLAPLILVIALLIKIDSPGPVFFRQVRIGRGMSPFRMLKFRTMQDGCSPALHREFIAELAQSGGNGDGLKKLTDDPRVTRVGKVIRRLSLDELPQLLNVAGGTMSLVGPRPALDYELKHYAPRHYSRFHVRPGISGLWQVSGRNLLGLEEMLDLDVEYATGRTMAKDVVILFRTPVAAIRHAA
jgi:lipopolysaccharide/colanic/teichoic acid biosynthesis glycosyltransferase